MKSARALQIAAVAAAIGWAAWRGAGPGFYSSSLPADAQLLGYLLPEPEQCEQFVRQVASRMETRTVYLSGGEALIEVSLSELGVTVDVERTLAQVRRAAHRRTRLERWHRAMFGPSKELRTVEPTFFYDENQSRHLFERIAPSVRRTAINAELDYPHHRRIDEQPGRELDIETTINAIAQASLIDDGEVQLQIQSVPPEVGSRELPVVDVGRVLSSFETSFAHRAGVRAINIRRGAQLLDGTLVQPHTAFSFNQVVGPRIESRGFVNAPVIINDEIDKGVGGGICQVASTLHAAAVYAGLPILERRSHSRPSGYAPLGLDATVIDGKVDLRLSNPYDEALLIHAFLPTRTSVRVEILGREPQWKIEHSAQVIKRHPFLRRVVEKPEFAPGEVKRSQKGTYGYDIVSVVRYTDTSGKVTTQHYKSNYYPVPEVFWVSPGTSLASLPPLPEGAEGIEDPD